MTRKKRSIKKELKANRTAGTLAFEHAVDLEYAIIDRMKELEINQSELAKKMNISKQALSKMLNTQPNMTLETIARFELALNTKLLDITRRAGSSNTYDIPVPKPQLCDQSVAKERLFGRMCD